MQTPEPQPSGGMVPYISQPIARVIAIPPDAAVDAIAEKCRALEALQRTQRAIVRALDRAREKKKQASKDLGRAVREAWDRFEKHNAGEDYLAVASALAATETGKPTPEQLKTLCAWVRSSRDLFLRHGDAVTRKTAELRRLKDKVDDLDAALRKCILGSDELREEADAAAAVATGKGAQQDLPGVQRPDRPRGHWMDSKTRKTIIDVVATDITETRKAIDEAEKPEDRAAAEANLREQQALADALKAMGLDDEDDGPGEREVASEDELVDEDEIDTDVGETNTGLGHEDDEPDPTQHEALQGAPPASSKKTPRSQKKPATNRADGGGKGKRK